MKRVLEWVVGIGVASVAGYAGTYMTNSIVARFGFDHDGYSFDIINICVVGGAIILGYLAAISRGDRRRIRGTVVAALGLAVLSAIAALLSGVIYRIPNDLIALAIGLPLIIVFMIMLAGSVRVWWKVYGRPPEAAAD